MRSKLGSSHHAAIPTVRATVTSRDARNGERKNTERPVNRPRKSTLHSYLSHLIIRPAVEVDANERTTSEELIPDALAGIISKTSAMEGKYTVTSDVDPCFIPLPVDVDDNDDILEHLVHVEATSLVTTNPVVSSQEDVSSMSTPALVKVDDALVAEKDTDTSPPAHVGFTNNANRAVIETELATIPSIDSAELVYMAQPEYAQEEVKKDALAPAKSLASVALVISDSVISIHGLHEEQVGASIEVEESAGLPANAVQAVHEIGQHYWKSIFDVSDGDLSSSEVRLRVLYPVRGINSQLRYRALFRRTLVWTRTSLRKSEKSSPSRSPSLRS